jgi:hypothetical protein
LISYAQGIAEELGATVDIGDLEEAVFDDRDFLQLFDAGPDGIMATLVAAW